MASWDTPSLLDTLPLDGPVEQPHPDPLWKRSKYLRYHIRQFTASQTLPMSELSPLQQALVVCNDLLDKETTIEMKKVELEANLRSNMLVNNPKLFQRYMEANGEDQDQPEEDSITELGDSSRPELVGPPTAEEARQILKELRSLDIQTVPGGSLSVPDLDPNHLEGEGNLEESEVSSLVSLREALEFDDTDWSSLSPGGADAY